MADISSMMVSSFLIVSIIKFKNSCISLEIIFYPCSMTYTFLKAGSSAFTSFFLFGQNGFLWWLLFFFLNFFHTFDILIGNYLGHFSIYTEPFNQNVWFLLIFEIKKAISNEFFEIKIFILDGPSFFVFL